MTQHYVGTKIVMAWPAEKDGKPGYGVKYADGYQSWSPVDAFDAAYLPLGHIGHLKPHEQRMIAEYVELDERIKKINAFLETDTFRELPDDDRYLIEGQAKAMIGYWNFLSTRVARFVESAPSQAA